MIDKDQKIRKGLGPQRDAVCLMAVAGITIPAGTIFRGAGDDKFLTLVGIGSTEIFAEVTITLKLHEQCPASVKRVVAA